MTTTSSFDEQGAYQHRNEAGVKINAKIIESPKVAISPLWNISTIEPSTLTAITKA